MPAPERPNEEPVVEIKEDPVSLPSPPAAQEEGLQGILSEERPDDNEERKSEDLPSAGNNIALIKYDTGPVNPPPVDA